MIGHAGHSEEENAYLPEFPVICSAFLLLHGFDYLGVARWFKYLHFYLRFLEKNIVWGLKNLSFLRNLIPMVKIYIPRK